MKNQDTELSKSRERVMRSMGINPASGKVHKSINPEKRFAAWREIMLGVRRRTRLDKLLIATSFLLILATAYLTWQLLETDFFSVLTSRYGWVTLPVLVANGFFLHWFFTRKHPDILLPLVRAALLNTTGILPLTQIAITLFHDLKAGGMVGEKLFPVFRPLLTSDDSVVVFHLAMLLTSLLTFFSMHDVFVRGWNALKDTFLSNADTFVPQDGSEVCTAVAPVVVSAPTGVSDITEALDDLGYKGIEAVEYHSGPIFSEHRLRLPKGQKADDLVKNARNISNTLGVSNITINPMVVGYPRCIDLLIPHNKETRLANVDMYKFLTLFTKLQASGEMHSMGKLPILFGVDVRGKPVLSSMPNLTHILIAGTTGGGKSKLVDVILLSMVMTTSPDDLELLLIDPKIVEMVSYSNLPHLREPIITDMRLAFAALANLVQEMEDRYNKMADLARLTGKSVRNIESYNKVADELNNPEFPHMKFVVCEIDEFADMIMNPNVDSKALEELVVRLSQKGRASGIHLILATQKPLVSVVTSLIKSNMPTRIALSVATASDSTVILDESGAQNLLGKGDFYISSMTLSTELVRGQGAFIPDDDVPIEVAKLVAKYPKPVAQPAPRNRARVIPTIS